jgi:hypothetical protein
VQLSLEPLHRAIGQADQLGRAVDANALTERHIPPSILIFQEIRCERVSASARMHGG